MKILPAGQQMLRVADVIAEFNRAPKAGDDGHVDDHARLSQVMFDIPQTETLIWTVGRHEEQWMILPPGGADPEGPPPFATWAEVREFVERPGMVAIAGDEHPEADGVTDHTDESTVAGMEPLAVYPAGVVGLSHAVAELAQQVSGLKSRIAALEAAQA